MQKYRKFNTNQLFPDINSFLCQFDSLYRYNSTINIHSKDLNILLHKITISIHIS